MIRLTIPSTDDDEMAEVRQVLASGYLTQGPKVAEFERLVAEYVGTKHAFATTSCTTAMHLSLAVVGIGPGDEVLVPDFTFPATANVVVQQGATPVLVDIDLDTFTMSIDDLEAKITPSSKAIMPVHAFGLPANMGPLLQIAKRHELAVIEDAACALGASYRGKLCGSFGQLACFSFHPRKIITTGEGGMITTDDDDLGARILMLRNHGAIRHDGRYTFEAAGYNYRLSDIQAAVGVAQMRKLESLLEIRRELAHWLKEPVNKIDGIQVPDEPEGFRHTFQSFVVLLPEEVERDGVITDLREQGIESTLGTYALHLQPFFQRRYSYKSRDLPRSAAAYKRSLTLPLYPQMTLDDIDRISGVLAIALTKR